MLAKQNQKGRCSPQLFPWTSDCQFRTEVTLETSSDGSRCCVAAHATRVGSWGGQLNGAPNLAAHFWHCPVHPLPSKPVILSSSEKHCSLFQAILILQDKHLKINFISLYVTKLACQYLCLLWPLFLKSELLRCRYAFTIDSENIFQDMLQCLGNMKPKDKSTL